MVGLEDKKLVEFHGGFLNERAYQISFDIDNKHLKNEPLKVLRLFFLLKEMFPQAKVGVDKTGNGYHVSAIGMDVHNIPLQKRVDIRDKLGDDPHRVLCDQRRLEIGLESLVETLFVMKRKRYVTPSGHNYYGKITFVESLNPIALPWISKIPARKS